MELNTTTRTILGKKVNRLRKEGLIPAEIFGHGFDNKHVSVPVKEFIKTYNAAGENTIVTLNIDGKEKIPVLITNATKNHLSDEYLSIDFYHIRKDEKIKTHVPVVYIGTDFAAKSGFLLIKLLDQIEIEALPDQIPHSFEIDISKLVEPGQGIEIKDISAEKGVKILTPHDTVIVTVTEKTKEKEEPQAKLPEEIPQKPATEKEEEKAEKE